MVTCYPCNTNQRQTCIYLYFMPIIHIYIFFINGNVWGVKVEILAEPLSIFIIYKKQGIDLKKELMPSLKQ